MACFVASAVALTSTLQPTLSTAEASIHRVVMSSSCDPSKFENSLGCCQRGTKKPVLKVYNMQAKTKDTHHSISLPNCRCCAEANWGRCLIGCADYSTLRSHHSRKFQTPVFRPKTWFCIGQKLTGSIRSEHVRTGSEHSNFHRTPNLTRGPVRSFCRLWTWAKVRFGFTSGSESVLSPAPATLVTPPKFRHPERKGLRVHTILVA